MKASDVGPRIYPSGAAISQTAGHGDFRTPVEPIKTSAVAVHIPAKLRGLSFIVDGKPQVLAAVRENLRQGATQIKVMAGGGVTSLYDPLDVSQFTAEELKAAVDAAEDWGTYVSVHIYNPTGIRRALEAGVKSIEHGHLIDEPTMKLMAEKHAFLSTQVFTFTPNQPGLNDVQIKRIEQAREGTDLMMRLARMYKVKVALRHRPDQRPQVPGPAKPRIRGAAEVVHAARNSETSHFRQRRTSGAVRQAQSVSGRQTWRDRRRRICRSRARRRQPAGEFEAAGRPRQESAVDYERRQNREECPNGSIGRLLARTILSFLRCLAILGSPD